MADEERQDPGPPLWSIGLVVMIMLVAPLLVYSLSPAGPVREGDTVFPQAAHKVRLADQFLRELPRFEGTCVVEPQDPLMVIERPTDRSDGLVLARIQGKTSVEWPFCPPQAEVLISTGQITQKRELWPELSSFLAGFLKSSS